MRSVIIAGNLEEKKDEIITLCSRLTDLDLLCVLPSSLSFKDAIRQRHIRFSFVDEPRLVDHMISTDTAESSYPQIRAVWTRWMQSLMTAQGIVIYESDDPARTLAHSHAALAMSNLRIALNIEPLWIAQVDWSYDKFRHQVQEETARNIRGFRTGQHEQITHLT